MKLKTILLYSCAIIFYWCICSASGKKMKLEIIQVLFRHGHRTPAKNEYPYIHSDGDEPIPDLYWPYGFGQLTNEGKAQAYKLGTLLRKKYDDFLGSYKPKEVYAITTNFDRTKMSLQLLLAGLYSPSAENTWNPEMKWQPIPYNQPTDEMHDINVLLAPHQLPKYKELHERELVESQEFQNKISKYADFLKTFQQRIGISNIYEKDFIYHIGRPAYIMIYHKARNMTLPSWYTDEMINTLIELYKISLDSMSMSRRLKRLNGGTLVRKAVENINKNRSAKEPKKVYLYSAHDLTVAAFLRAQNVSFLKIPPTGSAVVLEKYSDDQGKEYVRMVAWDGSSEDFMTLRFGDCEEYCPYEKYLKIVEDVIPTDEEIEYLIGENDSGVR